MVEVLCDINDTIFSVKNIIEKELEKHIVSESKDLLELNETSKILYWKIINSNNLFNHKMRNKAEMLHKNLTKIINKYEELYDRISAVDKLGEEIKSIDGKNKLNKRVDLFGKELGEILNCMKVLLLEQCNFKYSLEIFDREVKNDLYRKETNIINNHVN